MLAMTNFVATKCMLAMTKCFCCDRHVLVETKLLSQQAYFCHHDKRLFFVATKVSLLWQNFCHDKIVCCLKYLSPQQFCHDKNMFVMTSILLSQQSYVCRDRYLLQQKFCCNKNMFVMTKDVFCHDKNYTFSSSRPWCTSTYTTCQQLYCWWFLKAQIFKG